MRVFIEADAPRVTCAEHGVVVAAVPWARHDAGHARAFDDQVAWLVTHTSKTAVMELMRIAWRTVGAIAARVVDAIAALSTEADGSLAVWIRTALMAVLVAEAVALWRLLRAGREALAYAVSFGGMIVVAVLAVPLIFSW